MSVCLCDLASELESQGRVSLFFCVCVWICALRGRKLWLLPKRCCKVDKINLTKRDRDRAAENQFNVWLAGRLPRRPTNMRLPYVSLAFFCSESASLSQSASRLRRVSELPLDRLHAVSSPSQLRCCSMQGSLRRSIRYTYTQRLDVQFASFRPTLFLIYTRRCHVRRHDGLRLAGVAQP